MIKKAVVVLLFVVINLLIYYMSVVKTIEIEAYFEELEKQILISDDELPDGTAGYSLGQSFTNTESQFAESFKDYEDDYSFRDLYMPSKYGDGKNIKHYILKGSLSGCYVSRLATDNDKIIFIGVKILGKRKEKFFERANSILRNQARKSVSLLADHICRTRYYDGVRMFELKMIGRDDFDIIFSVDTLVDEHREYQQSIEEGFLKE